MKYIPIIALLLSINSYAQTCPVNGIEDWEKVKMRVIEDRENAQKYKLFGENQIAIHNGVNDISDLNSDEIKKIKEKAAKSKSCLVFVDLKDLYASDQFPIRKKGKLYFYWVLQRTEAEALAQINKIHDELTADTSGICESIKLNSDENGTKYKCGIITWSKKSPPPKEFKDIFKDLKAGELSKPFKSSYGYSIIYLVRKEKKETVVRHILITYQ